MQQTLMVSIAYKYKFNYAIKKFKKIHISKYLEVKCRMGLWKWDPYFHHAVSHTSCQNHIKSRITALATICIIYILLQTGKRSEV